MSCERSYFDHNNGAFNVDSKKLVGEDKISFNLLAEWGAWLLKGFKKIGCYELINVEAESKASLKSILDALSKYDPEKDPEVAKQREASVLKACSKKSVAATRKRDGESSTRARPSKILKTTEDYGIEIPQAPDFSAVLRVAEASMEMAINIEDDPDFQHLQEKMERVDAKNYELEGDLLEKEDKLSFCRDTKIPELMEENRGLRAQIASLATTDLQIAQCETQLAEGREEAERVVVIEKELTKAKEREAELELRTGRCKLG